MTNHGKPVVRLVPIADADPDLPLHRAASVRGGFSELPRHKISGASADTIDDLRGER